MERIMLGRTGLEVSVAGLGGGGYSRLGLGSGKSVENAIEVVRTAIENGVNMIDTSEVYGTEEAIGRGMKGFGRGEVVVSTKFSYTKGGEMRSSKELESSLDASLKRLRTDYVDIYHMHGVKPEDYESVVDIYYPELLKMKEKGKIRFCGVTELFNLDTGHLMVEKAMPQDLFDVIMIGYNMMNQSARKEILPWAIEKKVGIQDMFAVRNAFSNAERLKEILDTLSVGSLDWLVDDGYASSVTEAAYRFCRHTPGIGVVLTGTGNVEHLIENIKTIQMSPLHTEAVDRLHKMFEGVDSVSGQ